MGRSGSLFGRISVPGGKAQAGEDKEDHSRMLPEPSWGIISASALLLTRWNERLKNPVLFTFLS